MIVLTTLSDLATNHDNVLWNDNLYVYESILFQVRDCKINVVSLFGDLTPLVAPIEKVIVDNNICAEGGALRGFVAFATWDMEAINAFHDYTKDLHIDPNEINDWD